MKLESVCPCTITRNSVYKATATSTTASFPFCSRISSSQLLSDNKISAVVSECDSMRAAREDTYRAHIYAYRTFAIGKPKKIAQQTRRQRTQMAFVAIRCFVYGSMAAAQHRYPRRSVTLCSLTHDNAAYTFRTLTYGR